MNVLVLNCGSASTKFAVVHASNGHVHVSGTIEPLGSAQSTLEFEHEGRAERRTVPGEGIDASLRTTHELLRETGLADRLLGVGHRVVHGGAKFSGSILITPEVITK